MAEGIFQTLVLVSLAAVFTVNALNSPDVLPTDSRFDGKSHNVGQYEEQRDPRDGSLLPLQCHGSTGYCWCVDADGVPLTEQVRAAFNSQLQCVREREATRVGQYEPQHDRDGRLLAKQCHGGTGACWCVNLDGRALTGQVRGQAIARLDCERERREEDFY
ncbi:hypothetical protein BV898_09144 [Hypsibius exemplaris]|uniref:Thyroglobulin type-1 domain-containing protein n=1 Tax=Hypsibius exemplaris TaxID=2072580 RepID=A0A1W0WNL2_HYPEX|nr:hypothetical protein BV898_09144 [Hypsibius exemplaris]